MPLYLPVPLECGPEVRTVAVEHKAVSLKLLSVTADEDDVM